MNTDNNSSKEQQPILPAAVSSAIPLTPLQLNGYKLDLKHTLLTPEYLEELDKNNKGA